MSDIYSSVFRIVIPLLFVAISINLSTPVHSAPAGSFLPSFELSADSDEPIITYTMNHAMLENEDPIPLLRIYANGKVRTHFPVYMKKSGDYQSQLSKPELLLLIRSIISDGILDFDKNKVRSYTQQMDAQAREAKGEMFYVSDSSRTVIEMRLNDFKVSPTASVIPTLSQKFSWKDLPQQARRYPGSNDLVRAAAGAERLKAILDHTSIIANRR